MNHRDLEGLIRKALAASRQLGPPHCAIVLDFYETSALFLSNTDIKRIVGMDNLVKPEAIDFAIGLVGGALAAFVRQLNFTEIEVSILVFDMISGPEIVYRVDQKGDLVTQVLVNRPPAKEQHAKTTAADHA